MVVVVPWQALIDLIEPHYPKTSKKGGRPPYPLATMLRIHLLQQWYSLSDPAMEEALIEVPTMRRFAGIELISDRIPDETTILTFWNLLEKHELGERIFETVKAHLSARGMTMRQGTILDVTLIAAPSSTKNKEGKRDMEMHQTKKCNQWYYRFAGLRLRDESPYRRRQELRPDLVSRNHGLANAEPSLIHPMAGCKI